MNNVISAKRFVDDGAGLMKSSIENLIRWVENVNFSLALDGLFTDESCVCSTNTFISLIMDTQSCIDNGEKDLFVKPTDSRSYLNFGSAHSDIPSQQ